MQQRLLALEYERKSIELEEARRFQLSMLPKSVPAIERYDVAVYTQTATEVGGDYYDFHVAADGALSVTIGDATGHGAKAGTMVTVIKTLFSGYAARSRAGRTSSATPRRRSNAWTSAAWPWPWSLARFERNRMTLASAGMPPALRAPRRDRRGRGSRPRRHAARHPRRRLHRLTLDLEPGDTVLFMTDGFPELLNVAGQQLGYVDAQQEFADAASAPDANGVIALWPMPRTAGTAISRRTTT